MCFNLKHIEHSDPPDVRVRGYTQPACLNAFKVCANILISVGVPKDMRFQRSASAIFLEYCIKDYGYA